MRRPAKADAGGQSPCLAPRDPRQLPPSGAAAYRSQPARGASRMAAVATAPHLARLFRQPL